MRDGPRGFGQDSSCPALLRYRLALGRVFAYGPFTLCGAAFQPLLLTFPSSASAALQPRHVPCDTAGLGCCAFARRYSRNRVCFLFLRVLRCFSSPGWPHPYDDEGLFGLRVAPFGHPRFFGYLPLGAAFRSLSRPSSPPGAKASFMRPCLLSFFLSPSDRSFVLYLGLRDFISQLRLSF